VPSADLLDLQQRKMGPALNRVAVKTDFAATCRRSHYASRRSRRSAGVHAAVPADGGAKQSGSRASGARREDHDAGLGRDPVTWPAMEPRMIAGESERMFASGLLMPDPTGRWVSRTRWQCPRCARTTVETGRTVSGVLEASARLPSGRSDRSIRLSCSLATIAICSPLSPALGAAGSTTEATDRRTSTSSRLATPAAASPSLVEGSGGEEHRSAHGPPRSRWTAY
jgi:hypothetical protein